MIRSLLAFEWTYHRRQASSWAFAAGFFVLGFFFGGLGAFGEAELHRDGPWAVAYALGLLSLGSVFVVMVLAAHGVLRDVTYGMAPIVHATPISERRFLALRFLGVWTSSILVFSPAALGYWIGTRMPWIDPAQLGAGGVQAFFRPWLLLVVPNLLLASSLLCAIAAASRSRRLTYVGALLIYAFYMAGSVFVDSPLMAGSSPASVDSLTWAALLDPFGMAAFLEQTHLSTLVERNTRQLALAGNFLANRLLWVGVSSLILLAVGRTFRFRELVRRSARPSEAPGKEAVAPEVVKGDQAAVASYRPVAVATMRGRAWLRSLVACSRVEIGLLLRSRPFWLLLLVWVFILAMELVPRAFGGLEYGAGLYPTTALLISWLQTPLLLVSSLALVFYAGEVASSERDAGMEGLLDATPAPGRVRLLAKLLALAFLPLLLITVGILVMLACQLVASYPRHDVWADVLAYVGIFYFQGLRLFLLAALGLAIQTFVGRKYLGMVLTLLAFLSTSGLGVRAGLDHPLLRFGAAPSVPYTDMFGYAPSAGAFPWYMLYWSAWAVLFLLVADAAGARAARMSGGRLRSLRRSGKRRRPLAVGALVGAVFLPVATGAFLYQQSCGDDPCRSPAEVLDQRAAYERSYKAFEDMPEPTVVGVDARVDLYPRAGRCRMENRMTLQNEEDQALHEVFFTLPEGVRILDLQVEGAELTKRDDELGVWWFRWQEPLEAGEKRGMSYVLEGENGTFDLGGSWRDQDVVSNGTYLMEAFFAPRVGYRSSLEIDSNFERRKRGLPEKYETPGDGEHLGLPGDSVRSDDGYDWVEFEAVVSTEADQIALAPGRLVRQWQEGGRSFFHYASDGPMARTIAFASARYEVASVRHGSVDVEVYHHPEHPENVEHILDVARRSLGYCESSFGPYGRDHLRLVELPATWPFGGFAMPGTITLPSRGTFLVDLRDPDTFDLVAKRVAHEVAHQWWGHRVHPVTGPGGTLIVESLAKYAERVVLEALHGRRQTRELLEFEHRRYQSGRAADAQPEVPLAQVDGQAYLFYGKGYLAMNALRSELGAEVVNDKLRRFAETWAHPHPAPRAEDLLAVLESDTSPWARRVIDDWFRRMVHWQVRVVSASTAELPGGGWETRLEVETRKFETDADGQVAEIPMDDRIQVGLFASDDVLDPDPLVLESRYFDQSTTTLTLRTDTRPTLAGIDPLTVLIDPDRLDNLSPVRE